MSSESRLKTILSDYLFNDQMVIASQCDSIAERCIKLLKEEVNKVRFFERNVQNLSEKLCCLDKIRNFLLTSIPIDVVERLIDANWNKLSESEHFKGYIKDMFNDALNDSADDFIGDVNRLLGNCCIGDICQLDDD